MDDVQRLKDDYDLTVNGAIDINHLFRELVRDRLGEAAVTHLLQEPIGLKRFRVGLLRCNAVKPTIFHMFVCGN